MPSSPVGGADVCAARDLLAFAPTGFLLSYQEAWRRNVSGIMRAPLPFFSGVSEQDRLIAATAATLPVALKHPT